MPPSLLAEQFTLILHEKSLAYIHAKLNHEVVADLFFFEESFREVEAL